MHGSGLKVRVFFCFFEWTILPSIIFLDSFISLVSINKQDTLIFLLMLKKGFAKFLLICGWILRSWLDLVALMLQLLHHHHHLFLFHQRKAKGHSLRSNLVSFLNTRLSQIHLQLMEMDSEKVTRLCSSMGLEALWNILDLLEDFLASQWLLSIKRRKDE